MGDLYNALLSQPIYNALIEIYNLLPYKDLGVAIVLLTVLIKLALWPLTGKSLKSQKAMQTLQPKIEALKKKYPDKEEQAKKMMELYKAEEVNPFSSCLPLLIQLPILLALFKVLRRQVTDPLLTGSLYTFVAMPATINTVFFGVFSLNSKSLPLAILAGIAQYFQAKMLQVNKPPKALEDKDGAKDESLTASMTKSMTYTMPVITVLFGATLPAGVTLYWLTSNIIAVLQQALIFKANKEEDGEKQE